MQNDLRLEYVSLRTLQRQPRNPKDHDLGKIHTSIQQFGFVTPMIIDERTNRLVAGHGRLDALLQMKASGNNPPARIQVIDNEWYVPVVRGVSFESDLEAEAYTIADNRLTMVGGWDNEQLAALLSGIAAEDAALLAATGYDGDDVDALLASLNVLGENFNAARENNNFGAVGGELGDWVGMNFGYIMVSLPRDIYDRVEAYVDQPEHPSRKEAMIQILCAALDVISPC